MAYASKEEREFYRWLSALKQDIADIVGGITQVQIQDRIGKIFGKDIVSRAVCLLADRRKYKLATGATLLSSVGKVEAEGKR